MGHPKFLFILFSLLLFTNLSWAQCDVSVDTLPDKSISYKTDKEGVYDDNQNNEHVLMAGIQTEAKRLGDAVQPALNVFVARKGNKQLVIPAKLFVQFSDSTQMELHVTIIEKPTKIEGADFYSTTFNLTPVQFNKFKTVNTVNVEIYDTRSGGRIVCALYENQLRDQANCVAKEASL